jgi:mevalonate kinase
VAYLDQAVLLDASGQIEALLSQWPALPCRLYLWDSGQRRNTTPLVQHFLTMAEQISFQNEVLQPLARANAEAIAAFLAADQAAFWDALRQISSLQLAHFQPMILPQQQAFWQEGLASDEFLVKLCGAGGGGYALVFAKKALLGSDFMLWE